MTTTTGLPGTSDDELMLQVRAGDDRAFGELYDRHWGRAYRVARTICRDAGRAEDAVQEAFVSIWKSSSSYRSQRGSLSTWLLSITRYRAMDIARGHGTHARRRGGEEQLASIPAADDVAADVVEQTRIAHLHTLLGGLPERQREVIILAFYGELSHTEIADLLDLPAGTVKGRMRLGLQKLHGDAQLHEDRRG